MTWLIVLGCVVLAIWLIGRIRIGAAAAYSEEGLSVSLKAGPKKLQILPAQAVKTENKPSKAKKEKKRSAETEQPKPPRNVKDTVSLALKFLPLLGEAAGRLRRKIRIDRLKLHVIWGAEDPAAAAKGYGAGHAAMGILWPVVEHNFKVKEYDLRVDVDFERRKPELIADAQVSITIGQCFGLGINLGIKALKIYLGIRREQTEKTKNEKAVQA